MDQLTPSLLFLVDRFASSFRSEVFAMFRLVLGAWIVCLGRRTVSRVWETAGQSQTRDHSAAFRLFSSAVWNWDEVCRILISLVVACLAPGMKVWVAALARSRMNRV